jgi:hypothetical protein
MTYKINGQSFVIPPTSGQWIAREVLGISGSGHGIYPSVRQFQLSWQLLSTSGSYQLQQWFNSVGATGTVVIDLPKYGDAGYVFQSYTGAVLREPTLANYFSEHIFDVNLLVTNIRT